jgi:hypothetical protein
MVLSEECFKESVGRASFEGMSEVIELMEDARRLCKGSGRTFLQSHELRLIRIL